MPSLMSWTVHLRAKGPHDRAIRMVGRLRVDGAIVREETSSTGTNDRSAAEKIAEAWLAQLRAAADEFNAPAAVSCLMPLDLRIKGMEEGNSRERMEGSRKRLAPHLEAVALEHLDRARVLLAQDALAKEGRAASTVNTTVGALSAAWGWAHERNLVDRPFPAVALLTRDPVDKRPYTDAEAVALIEWARLERPWAHPILAAIADGGRRVSEVVSLKGRDVLRDARELHLRVKGNRIEVVPLSPEVMALIPEAAPDAFVWPKGTGASWRCALDPSRHVTRGAVLRTVKLGLAAIGVRDADRLDVHSLRRAFVASCDRAGVPSDVGRRVTGHKTRAMWEHYQAGYAGDNLHEAVAAVRARRYPKVDGGELAPDSPLNAKGQESLLLAPPKLAVRIELTTSSLRTPPEPVGTAACAGLSGAIHEVPPGSGDPDAGRTRSVIARYMDLRRADPELHEAMVGWIGALIRDDRARGAGHAGGLQA